MILSMTPSEDTSVKSQGPVAVLEPDLSTMSPSQTSIPVGCIRVQLQEWVQVLTGRARDLTVQRHPQRHPRLVKDVHLVLFDEAAAAVLSKAFDCHFHGRPYYRVCDVLEGLYEPLPLSLSLGFPLGCFVAQIGPAIDNFIDFDHGIAVLRGSGGLVVRGPSVVVIATACC
ncbi:MAG: hypothetical protein IVW52_10135 [Acidimicrobiales bacterium]|nr:hypothetical protein [Acidimicrobiales bacterium]